MMSEDRRDFPREAANRKALALSGEDPNNAMAFNGAIGSMNDAEFEVAQRQLFLLEEARGLLADVRQALKEPVPEELFSVYVAGVAQILDQGEVFSPELKLVVRELLAIPELADALARERGD